MLKAGAIDELNWGQVRPDHWSDDEKKAVYVLPVFVGAYDAPKVRKARRERIARFAGNIATRGARHLPDGSTQVLVLDLRGQEVPKNEIEELCFAMMCQLSESIMDSVIIEVRS